MYFYLAKTMSGMDDFVLFKRASCETNINGGFVSMNFGRHSELSSNNISIFVYLYHLFQFLVKTDQSVKVSNRTFLRIGERVYIAATNHLIAIGQTLGFE